MGAARPHAVQGPVSTSALPLAFSRIRRKTLLGIASHGFETITARLAKDYASFTEVAEKHGIEISAKRLRRVVHKVREEEPTEESMWRRLFDQTTSTLLRQSS